MKKLYGIGNPLMDSIHHVHEGAIEQLGFVPGSMNLIGPEQRDQLLALAAPDAQTAGGSCANTVRGVAWLATQRETAAACTYCGSVGHDTQGHRFESILRQYGVQSHIRQKTLPTGTSTILVTPDGQRTMFTYLGACQELESADVDAHAANTADILYVTGYMWDTPNQERAALDALTRATPHTGLTAIDIADPFVADRYRDKLLTAARELADLVFCNEQELRSLLELPEAARERVWQTAGESPVVWLVKLGAEGCCIINRDSVQYVPTEAVTPLDTTGAGDAFAAGFLSGLLAGEGYMAAAEQANRLAGGVVQVEGCSYELL